MFGWAGKILQINLTTGEHSLIYPEEHLYKLYIGGKGLAGYYLKDHITKAWDSETMPILFFNGPLVNTQSPTSGKMTIMTRSPLTDTVGYGSVGGELGTQIKKAGYDGIIITGKSERLSGIEIINESIKFTDAQSLKGLTNKEVYARIYKEGSIASVGPAAENGVYFASITVDNNYMAGRNGLGLVMANKNLKYLSVYGTGTTSVFDPEGLKNAKKKIFSLAAANPVLQGKFGLAKIGTGAFFDLNDFEKTGSNSDTMDVIGYMKKHQPKRAGCRGCHILCKKVGKKKEFIPEWETMSYFGTLVENMNIETVFEANRICNELGMDTISACATLACYKDISGKKIVPVDILQLLKDIGNGVNDGHILKLGSYRYAEKMGRIDSSLTVKKQELPSYDPRESYDMALAYITSTRGGCHSKAFPLATDNSGSLKNTDKLSFNGKAQSIKLSEDLNAIVDSLTACKFIFFAATLDEYAQALNNVTGMHFTSQDLLRIGERIYFDERLMNAKNGFTSIDDDLPERYFKESVMNGKGVVLVPINRKAFLKTRSEYYHIRGLDENGIPLPETQHQMF
ncbi:MAG: aldehyde ferredoxin oxidoreductase [Bacteroidetes bacterium]|nr:aldehyde ferredoxin oxidoreductase [Bacteroidota bacterium]MBL6963642.1 aldehyde ferredoxin oxidoreductase [Bacteroidota bacterium]